MINKVKEIIEKLHYNILKLDDSVTSNSDIYNIILMVTNSKYDYILNSFELTEEDYYLLDTLCCSMIPKPRNISEQMKYLDVCKVLGYVDEFITYNIEFGKDYDVRKYKYVSFNGVEIIKDYKLTEIANRDDIPFIINLSDGILNITPNNNPVDPQSTGNELALYSTLKSMEFIFTNEKGDKYDK